MRLSRVILTAVLSLGILLQGVAPALAKAPCPMLQDESAMPDMQDISAEHMEDMMAQMDCLTDSHRHDDGHDRSGTQCSQGMSCHSAVPALPSAFRVPVFQRVELPGLPDPAVCFQSHASMLLWRPPALI